MAARGAEWMAVWGATLLLCAGCDLHTDRADAVAPQEAHVYLAQLVTYHPMYADLVTVEEAIRDLQAPEQDTALPMFSLGGRLGGEHIAGPVLLAMPPGRWETRRANMDRRLAAREPEASDRLPADLVAKQGWKRRQAERASARELLEAQSKASEELAAEGARLFRENQERLNTFGERFGGTEESPDEVRLALEAQLDRLRRKHEERLARLELSLLASVDAKAAEGERAVRREARARRRLPAGGSGPRLGEAMLEEARAFDAAQWPGQVKTSLPSPRLPELADGATDAQVERGRKLARERMAEMLTRRRDRIAKRMLRATELAAEKIARERGVRLQMSPVGDAVGPDLTEEIGAAARQLWNAETQ